MAIALDKMLFPILATQEPSQNLTTFRQETLDLFLDVLRKYDVEGFEGIKKNQITSDMLIAHADALANQQGLKDQATFSAFMSARIPEGKKAKPKLLKVQDKMSLLDKITYAPKFLKFQNSAKSFYNQNKELVNKSGYKNVGDLQYALIGTLGNLSKTYGTLGSGSTASSSGGESSGGESSGGDSSSSASKTPSWVLPTIVLGGVGVIAAVFVLRGQPKKSKKRERR